MKNILEKITDFSVLLGIHFGWMNDNGDDTMACPFDDHARIKIRYLLFSIQLESGTPWTWQPMSHLFSPRNSRDGGEYKSFENTFRVMNILTLNCVSGGSHVIVSSIVTYYCHILDLEKGKQIFPFSIFKRKGKITKSEPVSGFLYFMFIL